MSKRPHLLVTVVIQHRLIKHRNLPDEPLSGLTKVLDRSAWQLTSPSTASCRKIPASSTPTLVQNFCRSA
jgi:hypothetical protein